MLADRLTRVLSFVSGADEFPSGEPTAYELIETITSSKTFIAPENGYYQIELFGSSGSGSTGSIMGGAWSGSSTGWGYTVASGAGGGGGGYARSQVKLMAGDIIKITIGGVSASSTVVVNTSVIDEVYDTLTVTGGTTAANYKTPGTGGIASGGNSRNSNGGAGKAGTSDREGWWSDIPVTASAVGGAGGSAGYTGGNVGGKGGSPSCTDVVYPRITVNGAAGKAAFCKISRGNTNLVA